MNFEDQKLKIGKQHNCSRGSNWWARSPKRRWPRQSRPKRVNSFNPRLCEQQRSCTAQFNTLRTRLDGRHWTGRALLRASCSERIPRYLLRWLGCTKLTHTRCCTCTSTQVFFALQKSQKFSAQKFQPTKKWKSWTRRSRFKSQTKLILVRFCFPCRSEIDNSHSKTQLSNLTTWQLSRNQKTQILLTTFWMTTSPNDKNFQSNNFTNSEIEKLKIWKFDRSASASKKSFVKFSASFSFNCLFEESDPLITTGPGWYSRAKTTKLPRKKRISKTKHESHENHESHELQKITEHKKFSTSKKKLQKLRAKKISNSRKLF